MRLNFFAILTGILAGYGSIAFRGLIGIIQNGIYFQHFNFELANPMEHHFGLWIIILPPIGFLIVNWFVRNFAPEAKGHGVPEVMEAVISKDGVIRKRIVAIKGLASALTIACGGSVGREGPIVQIGSAAGSALGQLFRVNSTFRKTLVGCGAAGAIAATFNTPIGGVIFAVELIVLELKTKSFIPLVISSVIATLISRYHVGNVPAFLVTEYSLKSPLELLNYVGLGLCAGFIGVVVIRSLYGLENIFDQWKWHWSIKSIIGGLVLGLLATQYPEILGVGYETVEKVLQGDAPLKLMAALILLKIFAMSLTLASGGSGGVFTPSLFIGAMVGGTYGAISHYFFPGEIGSIGAYALVGMAALFAGTGRAAFTAIVIIFEMTLDYSIILPLMFSCVVSHQVAWSLWKESIYSMKLKSKGLNYITDLTVNIMEITPIKKIMTQNIHALRLKWDMSKVEKYFVQHRHTVYPVLDDEGNLHGLTMATPLREKMKELPEGAKISDALVSAPIVAYPEESVMSAFRKVGDARDPRIFVVKRGTKKLLGVVAPRDLIRLHSFDE